jgi:hypothetical protein
MWFNEGYRHWQGQSATGPRTRKTAATRPAVRLNLEPLEDRMLPSSYTAATVSDLIADVNAANAAGGSNTITLTAATTSPYVLSKVDNTADGPTGLPVIAAGDTLTIYGNNDVIQRSSRAPLFRLLDVASNASLTLENLTLQNGEAFGSGSAAEGGGLYSQGTLVLNGVTVQNNAAFGSTFFGQNGTKKSPNGTAGGDAYGGGIWSSGALTCENGTLIENNYASGGDGGNAYTGYLGYFPFGGNGGSAFGGGVYIAGGTATLTGVTLSGNHALGGQGGNGVSGIDGLPVNPANGGNAGGGGLGAGSGTVTLCTDTVQSNTAQGGPSGPDALPGLGFGGGIYVGGGSATLCNDTIESNSTGGNSSYGAGGGIYVARGSATLCNDTIESNSALSGDGGGIYIASGATVSIDSFTVAHTINNTDSSGLNGPTANIDGSYIPRNC